jgi:ubiquinone/menaquinone biosynthesis C-methylase UbiE
MLPVSDITPAMIECARELQREKGLTNLRWEVSDVNPTPFADNSFSVVLTRYSFHHFLDPKGVLAEMKRVCKADGTIMVVDVSLMTSARTTSESRHTGPGTKFAMLAQS